MISIALTTFNGEKYIQEQLESILHQTYSDFELIIIDDCSNDNTFSLLKKYTNSDDRISLSQNKVNLGFKKNFEKAISLCKGDYIALSDQDDIWSCDHLQYLFDNIGDKSLVCSNANLINNDGVSLNISMREILRIEFTPTDDLRIFKHLLYENFAQGATMLFKKDLLETAFPIPDTIIFHDHWLALIAAANEGIRLLDKSTLNYRQHELNVTENRKWSFLRSFHKDKSNKYYLCFELYKRMQANLKSGYREEIEAAIKHHEELRKNKCHVFAAIHVVKNYHDIYWVKSKRLLIPRFLKVLFGMI